MTEADRDLFSALAWFEPSHDIPGIEAALRPVSLATWQAMELMGLQLFDPSVSLEIEAESAQLALFLWLHSEPPEEVSAALWDNTWPIVAARIDPAPNLVEAFRPWRDAQLKAIRAAMLTVRPRPKSSYDDTPPDVVGPIDIAFRMAMLTRGSSRAPERLRQVLWHLWLPQALQLIHAELRWNGSWTVPPGRETNAADFAPEATTPEWMEPKAFTAPE